jgi:hypothetical protein
MPRLVKIIKQFHFWHYIGVDNTGTVLIDTTTSISQDYTQRKVVDHSSLLKVALNTIKQANIQIEIQFVILLTVICRFKNVHFKSISII